MNYQEFVSRLGFKTGKSVKKQGTGHMACCPAHDDQDPSLSIREGCDGKILLKCFAGCHWRAVCDSLNIDPSDLFETDLTAQRTTYTTYSYTDEQGHELYRKIRMEPGHDGKDKSFYSEHTDENGRTIRNLQGCRRVLYRLSEVLKAIADNKSIFLVEGEKDADKLVSLGLIATTAAESIKWPDEFSETLTNADVVILYDMDDTGVKRKELLCQALYRKVKRLRVVDLPGLEYQASHGADVSDWLARGHTSAELLQITSNTPDFSLAKEDGQIDPLPLYRQIDAPQPFPMKALGPILGPAAESMHRVIRAPASICAQSVLAAASLATQAHANVFIDGREIPLSAFYVSVAESGDRKSATDKVALQPILAWQKMLTDCYRVEYPKFLIQTEAWAARKKEWLRGAAPNSNFTEPAPEPPIRPLMIVEEPTYEGVVKYFAADGQPSIGLFSDEGGRFFGGHAMNQDNRLKTLAGLSSLWDGKEISRMRSGDGDMLLYGRRLSLHLMIQEIILNQLLSNPLFDLQGFLPRCLIIFPQSMSGNRVYVEENLASDPTILRFNETINSLLDARSDVEEPPFKIPKNETSPRQLPLSAEAKKVWIAFHNKNDEDLAEGKPNHPIRRFASKAPEHLLRLSGTLALVEDPHVQEIGPEYIERAATLMQYYLTERLRIHGFIAINPDLVCAASLLKWFWQQGHAQVGLSMVYQFGPPSLGIRNADRARTIMKILTDHRWVNSCPNLSINGKKFKEAWTILPLQQREGC